MNSKLIVVMLLISWGSGCFGKATQFHPLLSAVDRCSSSNITDFLQCLEIVKIKLAMHKDVRDTQAHDLQLKLMEVDLHVKTNHKMIMGTYVDFSDAVSVGCCALSAIFAGSLSILGCCNNRSPVPRFIIGSYLGFVWLFVVLALFVQV
jgi:hypothetical protein